MHTISTLLTLERLIDAELERRFLGVQFEEKNLTARDKVIYGQYNDFHKKVYATCYELGLIESVTNEVITLNKNKIASFPTTKDTNIYIDLKPQDGDKDSIYLVHNEGLIQEEPLLFNPLETEELKASLADLLKSRSIFAKMSDWWASFRLGLAKAEKHKHKAENEQIYGKAH